MHAQNVILGLYKRSFFTRKVYYARAAVKKKTRRSSAFDFVFGRFISQAGVRKANHNIAILECAEVFNLDFSRCVEKLKKNRSTHQGVQVGEGTRRIAQNTLMVRLGGWTQSTLGRKAVGWPLKHSGSQWKCTSLCYDCLWGLADTHATVCSVAAAAPPLPLRTLLL